MTCAQSIQLVRERLVHASTKLTSAPVEATMERRCDRSCRWRNKRAGFHMDGLPLPMPSADQQHHRYLLKPHVTPTQAR